MKKMARPGLWRSCCDLLRPSIERNSTRSPLRGIDERITVLIAAIEAGEIFCFQRPYTTEIKRSVNAYLAPLAPVTHLLGSDSDSTFAQTIANRLYCQVEPTQFDDRSSVRIVKK